MNRQSWKVRLTGLFVAMTALSTLAAVTAFGQVPVDDQGNPLGSAEDAAVSGYSDTEQPVALSAGELDELIGPVALYPDDLLAIVLPASTYPLEIVQAARFLEQYEQDSTLQPNEDWDESVTALLNYPEVLRMMNDDIDWTWKLGDAVVNQQADVIAAVESFRDRAYVAGNLKSDQHQTVSEDDGIIEIVPVNEEIIYVPYYEPEQVVVRQVAPVYYYYPRPYPVYYYPYPVGYSFYSGYFWGVTTAFQIGWASDHLRVCHQSYWGHPYFGHSYYGHYYRSPSVHVYNSWYVNNSPYYSSNRYRDGDYWRPRTQSRARPAYYSSRTRSYRDSDVNRVSSSRGFGNSYTAQGVSRDSAREPARESSQPSASRSDRLATSGERVRTEQGLERGSTRNVRGDTRSDSIRFRERSENRQTVRRDSSGGATRSGTTTRTDSRTATGTATRVDSRATTRTTTRSDSRRSPVTTTSTNNRSRESDRETVVRRPATERSDSLAARQSNNSDNSRATRQTGNASQPIQRTVQRSSNRESARVEVRNSTPERREVKTESRSDTRQESRSESRSDTRQESRSESRGDSPQAQASVRQGSQARRDRN